MFGHTLDFTGTTHRTYSSKISLDSDGYLDRACAKCGKEFKAYGEDWSNLFRDEAVYCPFCHHEAESDQWHTEQQIEQGKQNALKQFEDELLSALEADAHSFNRSQPRNSFISLSLSVTGEHDYSYRMPIEAQRIMEQKLQCKKCNARYAVIGASFFCPCCGEKQIELITALNLAKVADKINNLDLIRSAFQSADSAETVCQSILEGCVSDIVATLQVLNEDVYSTFDKHEPYGGTLFQNMDKSDIRWHKLGNYGYDVWLSSAERRILNQCFQQRHLLEHCGGIVDQKYIDNSSDCDYVVGQRLIIRKDDILRYVQLAEKVSGSILKIAQ